MPPAMINSINSSGCAVKSTVNPPGVAEAALSSVSTVMLASALAIAQSEAMQVNATATLADKPKIRVSNNLCM